MWKYRWIVLSKTLTQRRNNTAYEDRVKDIRLPIYIWRLLYPGAWPYQVKRIATKKREHIR
jgi:hypothetical protein